MFLNKFLFLPRKIFEQIINLKGSEHVTIWSIEL